MTIYKPERISALYDTNFDIPNADESTKAVVRLTRNGYSHDYELTYYADNTLQTSEDVPEDLGTISLMYQVRKCRMESMSPVESDAVFEVKSFEHNGKLIYPSPASKVWPDMVIPTGMDITPEEVTYDGFAITPSFNSVLKVSVTYNGETKVLDFYYMGGDTYVDFLYDNPFDGMEALLIRCTLATHTSQAWIYEEEALHDISLKVISYTVNGETIYP